MPLCERSRFIRPHQDTPSSIIRHYISRYSTTQFHWIYPSTGDKKEKKKKAGRGGEERKRKFWPLIGLNRIAVALFELGDWKLGSRQTARREDTFVAISLSRFLSFFFPLLFPFPSLLFLSHIYNRIESYSERRPRKTSDSNRRTRLSIENLLDSNEALLHADLTSLWTVYRTLLQIPLAFLFPFFFLRSSIDLFSLAPILEHQLYSSIIEFCHSMHLVLLSSILVSCLVHKIGSSYLLQIIQQYKIKIELNCYILSPSKIKLETISDW